MSQSSAVAIPPPTQKPSIIAIIGLSKASMALRESATATPYCASASALFRFSLNSDMSGAGNERLAAGAAQDKDTDFVIGCIGVKYLGHRLAHIQGHRVGGDRDC